MAYTSSGSSSSSSSNSEVTTCSKSCLKSYKTLKKQYHNLRTELYKSKCNLADYKKGLTSVEEQVVHYQTNESLLNEKFAVLKRDLSYKNSEIAVLKSKLEKISKAKDDLEIKIKKFENASQSLDKLIGSQITDNSKKGLGYVSYNTVPPPHTRRFSPPRIDLSHTGLPEFTEPSIKIYGVKPIEVDWESDEKDEVESPFEIKRKTIASRVDKVEVGIPKQNVKPAKRPVKYAKMLGANTIRGKGCGEDRLKLKELIELCTKLSDRVLDLEKTKTAQAKEIANLKKKVKKLERKRRSRTPGMNLFKIGTSRRSLGEDDAFKHWRNLKKRSIFEESDFDVSAMMDAYYELATRLRAEKQRRKPLTKAQKKNQI
nr:hypothetical protein [Tanacetum cinerariifolium]